MVLNKIIQIIKKKISYGIVSLRVLIGLYLNEVRWSYDSPTWVLNMDPFGYKHI